MGFSEVTGLDIENEIGQRKMKEPVYSDIKLPGLRKFTNITLKRGVVQNDSDFLNWLNETKGGNKKRLDLTITMLDEKLQPVGVWKVKNSWPIKVEGPNLKGDGNDVVIETIVLEHEGLVLQRKPD